MLIRRHPARTLTALSVLIVACGGADTPASPPPTISSIVILPASSTLLEGDSVDLRANIVMSDGSTGSATLAWASSPVSVASVSSMGRVTALTAGDATISASAGGRSGTATVTVSRRVTSVVIDRTDLSLVPGQSTTLNATIRFGDGSPATGKTITWTSTAPAVASVSTSGVVTAIATGTATVEASVDGRKATTAITVRPPATTTLDAAARVVADVGPDGGVLSSTSGSVTYRLEIPPGAVAISTSITMTPVTTVGHLPLSGGLVGAVDLQPAGLMLARAAKLHIGTSAPARPGFVLSGFAITGDGSRTQRAFAGAATTDVVVLVDGFATPSASQASSRVASTAALVPGGAVGAAFGTTQELKSLTPAVARSAAVNVFVDDFLDAMNATPPDGPAMLAALIAWFDAGVLPQLQNASSDQDLLSSLLEFQMWAVDVFSIAPPGIPINVNDPALSSRRAQWRTALTPKLIAALQGNNTACLNQQDFTAMLNVLFWQSKAEFYGIATGALQRGTVLQGLCATLVAQNVVFPDPVQTDFPTDLDVNFAVRFGPSGVPVPVPVSVSFTAAGATFGKASPANSDASGFFTVAVTATGNSQFSVNLIACLVAPGATDVCVLRVVNGSSQDISGDYIGNFTSTISTPGGIVVPVNVPISVSLNQTQNGIVGTYEVKLFNGQRGSVSAILNQVQLLNFTLNQFMPCPGVLSGAATFNSTTRNITASYSGSDCQGMHTNGSTTLRPGTNNTRFYGGAWGKSVGGELLHVVKVRQTGTTVDVSHALRTSANLPFECRAFYRGTVNGTDGLLAIFRAFGGGSVGHPPAGAGLQFFPSPVLSRGADIYQVSVDNVFFDLTDAHLLFNPPSGCDP